MAAAVKRLQKKKKEWHCQLKSSRCSFYKFARVHAKFLMSPTAPVTFQPCLRAAALGLWVFLAAGGSRGGVLVVSTFLYFCRGLFDMQHCCSVIMPGLWLTWRLALSKKKLQQGNQSAWKVPPLQQLLNFTSRLPCSGNNPPLFAEGSEWIKNKVFSLLVSGFLQMSEVKCVAECAVELGCMNWWGVRLHTLLWSERWEFKGPAATLNQLMKPLTPLSTCLAVVLFTIPLPLKGWICGGYCRLKPADRKQSQNQTLNNSMERFSSCLMNLASRVRREAGFSAFFVHGKATNPYPYPQRLHVKGKGASNHQFPWAR